MLSKLFFVAVPLLFLGSMAMAEDIVYDNDWRAGETGYIHHRGECGWQGHHHYRHRVAGVSYNSMGYDDGVAYDTEYAPNTTFERGYATDSYGPNYRFGARYEGDRGWRDGRRDFDRRDNFRNDGFRDRDAGVGAGVHVGGHDGVNAGARVNDDGVGAGVHVGGHDGVGIGVNAH